MTTAVRVPETARMTGGELTADDAWVAVRRYGWWPLARAAFVRFRYADGFSHARALALALCLAVIPFLIAFVGLGGFLHAEGLGQVLRRTLLSLTPGGPTDMLATAIEPMGTGHADGDEAALWVGLLVAAVALTVAMGQLERGANRIYGIRRDRPSREKYGRAAVLAVAAGLPCLLGFLVLLGAADFGDAVEDVYGLDAEIVTAIGWPVAVALVLGAIMAMMRHGPRRAQPGWSWLAVGAAVAGVCWLVLTGLLAGYVQVSVSFGAVYGPLTGVVALLVWAQLTSVALLFGLAVCAQLEAARVGLLRCAEADPERAAPGPAADGCLKVRRDRPRVAASGVTARAVEPRREGDR